VLSWVVATALPLSTVWAQRPPEIGFVSPDVVTDIGGDAEIMCTVRNNPKANPYPVSWMRLGNVVTLSSGSELQIKDHRMEMKHDPDMSSYTLSITNVRKSDATKYRCQVVLDADHIITKDTEIHVRLAPVIVAAAGEPTVRTEEGQSADLTCNATGYPPPTIDWSRVDGSLMPNGKASFTDTKLRIDKAKRADRGMYECYAHNEVGTGQKKTFSLEVEFSPEVRTPLPRVSQALGYKTTLECEIEAYPPPSIIWTRDGKEITNNGSFLVSHFAKQDEKIVSTVQIDEVNENMYGKYECQALNRHGKDSKMIELYKSEMPICPPLCGDTDLDSGSTNLQSGGGVGGIKVVLALLLAKLVL